MLRRTLTATTAAACAVLAFLDAYLLVLLVAAQRRRAPPPVVPDPGLLRFIVLVPARDEEQSIATTLGSLAAIRYPDDRFEVIVLADNCGDRTEEVALRTGATVWSHRSRCNDGKAAVIAWGVDRLLAERPETDAVVFVDADCEVSRNLLLAIEARMRGGADAVQADNVVANPGASWTSALGFASFSLINTVRPLGKSALGLSAGLFGTGMAFHVELLKLHPRGPRSLGRRISDDRANLIEDADLHLRLVAHGVRVVFAPEASVSSPMPTTLHSAESQQLRWEGGRIALIRTWVPRLLVVAAQRRDPACLHAAFETLVPPQSVLAAANAATVATALGAPRRIRRIAVATLAGQACFVGGGLAVVRAPRAVWQGLALAPLLALWKLRLLFRLATGKGPTRWVRTKRATGRDGVSRHPAQENQSNRTSRAVRN
jgi:1,2-diacylglycerol 3-beta-glucosyltransferase